MSIRQRAQDILIGVLFGLVLGIIGNVWSSAFDHLFLENKPKESLYGMFAIFTIGIFAIGYLLWDYAKKLGNETVKETKKRKK